MRLGVPVVFGLLAAAVIGVGTRRAQVSDDVVRIGVLNDQSNVYADLGGPGSVIAARMAIDDVGGKVLGKPIDMLVADHQSKADVGASIARQWFDSDKVDLVIGFDNSSVALAVEQVAFQKNRIAIAGAIGTTAFTGKACTPNEAAWVYDAYALTNTLARSVVRRGQDTWFFITVDYSLGHSLEADATSAVVGERRKGAGQRASSSQHCRFQCLPAAGAGIRRQGRGAGERRRRYDQCHQAGQRIRIDARGPDRRVAAHFHH